VLGFYDGNDAFSGASIGDALIDVRRDVIYSPSPRSPRGGESCKSYGIFYTRGQSVLPPTGGVREGPYEHTLDLVASGDAMLELAAAFDDKQTALAALG
jgi:hypothetical protein